MKTTKIALLTFLLLIALTPTVVNAQDTTPTVTPGPKWGLIGKWLQNRKNLRGDLKDNHQDTRNEDKTLRKELSGTPSVSKADFRRQRMITNQTGLYNSFVTRLNALKNYQPLIQTRLDAKKAKLPTNQNLIDAQTKLDSIAALLTTSNSDLATYKTTVDSISTATDPTTLLVTLKAQAKTVNTDIINVRQTLVAALRLIVQAK